MEMFEVTLWVEAYHDESSDEIDTAIRDAIDHNTDLYATSVTSVPLTTPKGDAS